MPPSWGDPGGGPRGVPGEALGGPGAAGNIVKLNFLSTALDPQADVILSQNSSSFLNRFSFG